MKKKRIFLVIILLAIIAVAAYFVITMTNNQKRKQEFEDGYTAFLDKNIKEYLNDRDKYGEQLNVTEISYEITDISKGYYSTEFIPWVSVSATYDSDTADSTKKQLLAYEICNEVIQCSRDHIKIGDKYSPSYYPSGYDGRTIAVSLNGDQIFSYPAKLISSGSSSSSSSGYTVKCKSCGREFDADSENAKSIRRTNMCTNCYNNYKSMSDALKEVPKN